MNPLEASGHRFIALLQEGRSPALDGLAAGTSFLGDELFYLVLIPILYWTVQRGVALRLAVLMLASTWLNGVLKALVDLPRPSPLEVAVLEARESGGLPSGHAQNAVVVWGFLAGTRPVPWVLGGAGAIIFAIGVSRIYLGAHFPHDVVVGWVVGAVLLAVFLRWGEVGSRWLGQRVSGGSAGPTPASSSHPFPASLRRLSSGSPSPPSSASPASSARRGLPGIAFLMAAGLPVVMLLLYREHEALPAAAALLGAAVGAVWERRWLRFSHRGPLLHLAVRLGLGLAGAFLIYAGLRGLLSPLGDPGRILRYGLLGWWVTAGAPLVFLWLGVASRSEEEGRVSG